MNKPRPRHPQHKKHECAYCGAVYRCKPARELRGIKAPCRTPYYWPCPECWKAQVWEHDQRFAAHVKAHYQEAWGL